MGVDMPLFGIFGGIKLCTILSGGLAGVGPTFHILFSGSVEMPCLKV